MFVGNMDINTIDKIKSFGVIVYKIPDKFINSKIIKVRWKIYEEFLSENKDKYNLIFTTDLRDSFFQKDVFKFYDNNKKPFLGIALEDGTISSEFFNRLLILRTYGRKLYKSIKYERIIYAGTLWGTADKFLEFIRIMWENFTSKWSLGIKAVDQGTLNYLIYYKKIFNDCLIKSDNKDGRVMTIALTERKSINFDLDYNVLNDKGEIASSYSSI